MLLILEGIDKCGKSTFASRFGDQATIIHCTKYDDMMQVLKEAISLSKNRLVILDRNFLSEMCYGPVYRGNSCITPAKMMRIKKWLSGVQHCILYFDRPKDELKQYDMNDEFEKDAEKLMQVQKRYEDYIKKYRNAFNIYQIQYK